MTATDKKNDKLAASEEEPVNKVKKVTTPQLVRGMHDILPAEWPWWDTVLSEVATQAATYGFGRIETPAVEKTALFTRAIGTATDIVEKEMYSFVDQSDDHLSLRPEYTAGIARAFIEHGMLNLPQPVKLCAIGPVFRHERPQAGRYRGLWQADFETLGDASPASDAQLIMVAASLLEGLQLSVTVQINSVGCLNCRPAYKLELQDYYRTKRSVLCEDCKKRLPRNPLRLLDCKQDNCRQIAVKAPQLVDSLCPDCRQHFVSVLEYLDEVEISYQLNSQLVRGLDYYTRTVFELWSQQEGQLALVAGGRYDNLVEELGGPPTPAIGFAAGIERLIIEMKSRGVALLAPAGAEVFVACLGEPARKRAFKLFDDLRRQGVRVAENFAKDGLKSQLEIANRLKVKFTLVVGQKELMDGTIIVRDMENGIQEVVDFNKVVAEVKKRLAAQQSSVILT